MKKDLNNIKIAYIGGGSRGWAWGLMSDLASAGDISGSVALYDIDFEAAHNNEIIGNRINDLPDCKSKWSYKAVTTMDEAMQGADFVVISILPGTFEEMKYELMIPQFRYSMIQSVGDTTGAGGVSRALRAVPMMEEIARAVEKNCPEAWVINYTNPMTLCVKALYDTFPGIKAFGCCHEVFGTQKLLCDVLEDIAGIEDATRDDIKVNVVGVNHFTWFTSAQYKDMDLFELFAKFCDKYSETGFTKYFTGDWINNYFLSAEKVKMDLFKRFGYIAAAGDRHLAEFCPRGWYLSAPDKVAKMKFRLTPIEYRTGDLQKRLERSARLVSGEEQFKISNTGEEGVNQMRALLGLRDLVTNVNIPNRGQIPNLPMGAVVETNAAFSSNTATPVMAGNIPDRILPLIARVCGEQMMLSEGIRERDLEKVFTAFISDPQITIGISEARELLRALMDKTKAYLSMYDVENF